MVIKPNDSTLSIRLRMSAVRGRYSRRSGLAANMAKKLPQRSLWASLPDAWLMHKLPGVSAPLPSSNIPPTSMNEQNVVAVGTGSSHLGAEEPDCSGQGEHHTRLERRKGNAYILRNDTGSATI